MNVNAVKTIAMQELVINIRNKWTLIFAVLFGVLVLAISYFGLVTAGEIGFQGFARTSLSLLNLVLYLIPPNSARGIDDGNAQLHVGAIVKRVAVLAARHTRRDLAW
jgi:hypothetical protein